MVKEVSIIRMNVMSFLIKQVTYFLNSNQAISALRYQARSVLPTGNKARGIQASGFSVSELATRVKSSGPSCLSLIQR